MIHPHSELRHINGDLGFGVVATQLIPQGTLTWVRDELDQVVTAARMAHLPADFKEYVEKYTTRDLSGNYLLCWDLGRLVNHSCAPTSLDPGSSSSLEVAVRDILPGEQLTSDYANLQLQPHESFACFCGAPECRRWITPADVIQQSPGWDNLLREAIEKIPLVAQPLWPLFQAGLARNLFNPASLRLGLERYALHT